MVGKYHYSRNVGECHIKLRHRSVMSIFTDLFNKKVESLKIVR